MTWDVVTLGEVMVRLTPPNFERIEQARTFQVTAGGAELNVAVGLARLGLRTAWVSKLTANPLGRLIVNEARAHGVDTSPVVWTDDHRIGVYFLEEGSSPRPSEIVYDRRGSAASTLAPEEVDWPSLLCGVRAFHTSGITPALSDACRRTTAAALAAARAAGCLTSFDLNYRGKLWTPAEARGVLSELLPHVDILLGSPDTIELVFGYGGTPEAAGEQMRRAFGLRVVALTLREAPTVLRCRLASVAVGDTVARGGWTEVEIVDRVGGGDAYTAGFLYAYLTGHGDLARAVAYGDALNALKHTVRGDLPWFTLADVGAQLTGRGTGIIR